MNQIAALFVETDGAYFGLPGVQPWDILKDARLYPGPWPVVAHPDCKRWVRFSSSHPTKPGAYTVGDDNGCFESALASVRRWGGVLEHPHASKAWATFGLNKPPYGGGWIIADDYNGWTCCVEQGHYGHFSRKPTWLYAVACELPSLTWGRAPQRLPAYAVERYGYEKARRIGVMAAVGGKNKTRIRNATPPAFRDVLIAMARSASPMRTGGDDGK